MGILKKAINNDQSNDLIRSIAISLQFSFL